ncbi:MAG: segregation/condensation protein A [Bacteroidota bacterium]
MDSTYTIKLDQFEGPFDLLLFFIERDELDINDIPIAKITGDFLEYIHQMERMNIDLASEFILVAATLCRIKAKLLIPRKEKDEEGNEIDPRDELVRRLLEYKKYKSILEEMRVLEEHRSTKEKRGNVTRELKKIANKALVDIELESLNLFKLLRAFERVTDRYKINNHSSFHQIVQFSYTIEDQQDHLLKLVHKEKKVAFEGVFAHCRNRIHAIVTFLALLELANLEKIVLTTGFSVNQLWIEPIAEEEE